MLIVDTLGGEGLVSSIIQTLELLHNTV